jgi:flagellar motor switch/type III secretory pathway protein FliN
LIQPDSGPPFAAIIKHFPFAAMFGPDLEMIELRGLPPALRGCLEEGIVSTLWHAIPDNRMGEARIIVTGPLKSITPKVDANELQWLSISIENIASEPISISIGLTMSSLISTVMGGALAPAAIGSGLAYALPSEASYTLGNVTVTYRELAELGPGDVVVLPQLPPDLVLLRAQGRCYAFRLIDQNWTCLGREVTERYRPTLNTIERTTAMSQDPADEPITGLDALGVIVDFDLGRMSIPLAQLQSWQPGSVVPLDRPPASQEGAEVSIRANGQAIGIGDLVRIEDRIAVRITRLFSKAE